MRRKALKVKDWGQPVGGARSLDMFDQLLKPID
jgi:hypothetical protein